MNDETRAVLNSVYRIGKALDRKFEASDLTSELRQAARVYAATYEGDFPYMLEMRDRVAAGVFIFASDQVNKAILNCLMADARRRLSEKVELASPPPAATAGVPTNSTLSIVPDGRYRVTLPDGDHLALKLALAGNDSKFADSRIVSTRIGGDEWMGVGHIGPAGNFHMWRSCSGDLRRRVYAAIEVLDQAKAQDEWLVAGLAFAQEGSQCFICGRDLDTPESLTAGYGPTCADKHGLPWGAKAVPMSVRLAQAEAPASAAEITSECTCLPGQAPHEPGCQLWAAPTIDPEKARLAPVSLAEAKARGYKRTYDEIFGDAS
jgi:hypothetical protein